MSSQCLQHATLTFERTFAAPIDRVFAAYADPVERARWSVPSDTAAFVYDEADFRVGGRDLFRCGAKDDPQYHGETVYHEIVPGERIVWSETVDTADKRLSVGLTTTVFEREGAHTKLKVTVQLVSLDGDGMIEGTKIGTNAALNNLVKALQ